jgi:hypothetical protein
VETFDYFYRKLTHTTAGALLLTSGVFLLALLCAVLGLSSSVATLNAVTLALAYAFGVLLIVFLVTSLVRAMVHFLTHRNKQAF